MPLFMLAPAVPPFCKLDSKTALHMAHWAIDESWQPKKRAIKKIV
jgi:hypothetical protein